jgi:hypothetical protein
MRSNVREGYKTFRTKLGTQKTLKNWGLFLSNI